MQKHTVQNKEMDETLIQDEHWITTSMHGKW